MFRGIVKAKLDAKGRMALPMRFREPVLALAEGKVVATIDIAERCLLLYPLPEWEVVQRKLEDLANVEASARLLQRLLIGHATDIELDASGRLLLTDELRSYANLNKNLVLAGQGNKVEIWSEDSWRTGMDRWLNSDLAEQLAGSAALVDLRL